MNFNPNQVEAINFYKGCCNVIASAGSGKTGVLVNRIANLINTYSVRPENILAITFSKKAKENMKERLSKIIPFQYAAVNIETFHSFGYKIIKMYSDTPFTLLDADWKKQKIIEDIYKNKLHCQDVNGKTIAKAISTISLCKNKMIYSDVMADQEFRSVYNYYENYKRENGLLDFDDMLSLCYEILSKNNEALEYCQNKFEFILADEMQDTNLIQYEIIKAIGKKKKNIFIVNDPLQNIYMWRGSDNCFVLNFHKDWKKTKIINLNTNYRSTSNIVEYANRFASTIPESHHEFYVESVANAEKYCNPAYSKYENETDEAQNIADKVTELMLSEQYSYNDIAILARTNAQLQNLETSFYSNKIPYDIIDGASFVERKEIKIVLSYLKLSYDLNNNDAFEYIYNKPNRWLGKEFMNEVKLQSNRQRQRSLYCSMFKIDRRNWRFKNGIDEICVVINSLRDKNYRSVKEQISYLREKLNIDSFVSKDLTDDNNDCEQTENLNSLEEIASKYSSLSEFLTYIEHMEKSKHSENSSVKLMTIHKSKGLEFPVVFIIGLSQGILPHHRNQNIDEEKRLMYVAMTRAEKELYCSSIKQYQSKDMEPSEFIETVFLQIYN